MAANAPNNLSAASGPGPSNGTATDDLFDYGLDDLDDILGPENRGAAANDTSAQGAATNDDGTKKRGANDIGDVLGLDEEVKTIKTRRPNPKLDEERLLSENGISKLRRTAESKLKFEGKGHEYTDTMKLLRFYQFWLDDLYPRAKFADGLAMIEKLGHSKRMQVMRRTWIDEAKPRLPSRSPSPVNRPSTPVPNPGPGTDPSSGPGSPEPAARSDIGSPVPMEARSPALGNTDGDELMEEADAILQDLEN